MYCAFTYLSGIEKYGYEVGKENQRCSPYKVEEEQNTRITLLKDVQPNKRIDHTTDCDDEPMTGEPSIPVNKWVQTHD